MHAHCRLRQTKLRCGAVTKSTLWPAQIGRLHFWYKICTTIKYVARRTTTTPSGTQLISYVLLGKLVLLFACNYLHISFVAVKKYLVQAAIPRRGSLSRKSCWYPSVWFTHLSYPMSWLYVSPEELEKILRRKNTASSAPPHHRSHPTPFDVIYGKKQRNIYRPC